MNKMNKAQLLAVGRVGRVTCVCVRRWRIAIDEESRPQATAVLRGEV